MPWARIDDHANTNAKLLALSDSAFRLWVCGLIYCQSHLTDGFIPASMVPTFGVKSKKVQLHIAHELCASLVSGKGPLWHQVEGGYQVHHYDDWNESRRTVLDNRERTAERQRRFKQRRDQPVSNALVTREQVALETVPTPPTPHHPPTPPTKIGDTRVREGVNPHARPTNLVNGSEVRAHGSHAWCSWPKRDGLCLPHALHSELMGRTGKAAAEMFAFYDSRLKHYEGVAIGDNLFDFWRNEVAAWVGTVTARPATASTKASRTVEAGRRVLAAIERGEI